MERRFVDERLEVRATGDDEKGTTLAGYAAVFNSLSQVIWGFREKIAPGAFGASLVDDVRALWNHDSAYVLGRTTAGTLRLSEDAHGLRVEIDPPDTPLASSFVESVRRGDVSQMSFGFRVLEDTWDEDEDGQEIRTLLKIKLYEVSPVTFPAYTETEIGLRALMGDEVKAPNGGVSGVGCRVSGGVDGVEQETTPDTRHPTPEQRVDGVELGESDRRAPVEIEETAAGAIAEVDQRALAAMRARRLRLAEAMQAQVRG